MFGEKLSTFPNLFLLCFLFFHSAKFNLPVPYPSFVFVFIHIFLSIYKHGSKSLYPPEHCPKRYIYTLFLAAIFLSQYLFLHIVLVFSPF